MTKSTSHRTYRFGVLLATLLALIAGYVLLDYTQKFLPSKVVLGGSALLLSFVLLAAVLNVRGARSTLPMWVIRGVGLITVLVLVLGATLDSQGAILFARALAILCIGYAVFVLLGFLTRATKVDSDAIHASVCVYLLMGIAWALWYSLLYFLEPGSFGEGHGLATFGQRAMVGELYYSLVTLTTLGYGDVAPLSTAARMSAALEAVIGQIYVVIVVAKLVGLNISQTMTDNET